jgi:hypothetical protein
VRFGAYFSVLCHNDPHVQVRLSTLRKLFAPSLPPRVITYDDLLNSRPPNGVLTLVNSLSTKRHRTLHHADTDEEMVSLDPPAPLSGLVTDPRLVIRSRYSTGTLMGQNRRVNTSWVDVIGVASR